MQSLIPQGKNNVVGLTKIPSYGIVPAPYHLTDLLDSQMLTGCCPDRNPFERSLKRFLQTNLGEAEDKRCQLFEP